MTRPPACGATSVLDVSSMRSTSSSSGIGRDPYRPFPGNPEFRVSRCAPVRPRRPVPAAITRASSAEVLAVRGGEVARAARATSPACPGRASGSRSARTVPSTAQPHAALELDLRAGPAELRPGLGVELEVEVGAEAARVDLRAELLARARRAWRRRSRARCPARPGCRRGRARAARGGRGRAPAPSAGAGRPSASAARRPAR